MSRTVIIFERMPALCDALKESLETCGVNAVFTSEKVALLRTLEESQPALVILGPLAIGSRNNLELAQEIRNIQPAIQILLVVNNSSEELAIAALHAGIREYVKYPFAGEELRAAVRRCLGLPIFGSSHSTVTKFGQSSVGHSSVGHSNRGQAGSGQSGAGRSAEPIEFPLGVATVLDGIIGESTAMREIRGRIARVASSDSNVLITGETGTGKELMAEAVHGKSARRGKPLVAINCAAIPDSLLESELFGYAKGAFTGADASNEGRLKAADKGTVFLDEIGDMSGYAQAKILRMLESKEIQRLGCNRGIPLDVRVIAATNQDLEKLSRENKFRKDLYFRLNVARIHLPPLRERKEDLLSLIDYYVGRFNRRFGRKVRGVSEEALNCLLAYDWPGNVRELKNLLESIFVESSSSEISLADLPLQLRLRCDDLKALTGNERERLLWALSATNWNKSKAADKLNWSRMTLYRKMVRYNISRAG